MMSECFMANEDRRNMVKVKYESYYALQIRTLKYLPPVQLLIADSVGNAGVRNHLSFVVVFKCCHITKKII